MDLKAVWKVKSVSFNDLLDVGNRGDGVIEYDTLSSQRILCR